MLNLSGFCWKISKSPKKALERCGEAFREDPIKKGGWPIRRDKNMNICSYFKISGQLNLVASQFHDAFFFQLLE